MVSRHDKRVMWSVLAAAAVLAAVGAWVCLRRPPAAPHPQSPEDQGLSAVGGQPRREDSVGNGEALVAEATGEAVSGALENLEAAVRAARPSRDPAVLLAAEFAKREKVARQLPPYSQREALLKDAIRDAEGAIARQDVPGLVEYALTLEQAFWEKGDFDDVSSFESIYEARAVLELCLEADPESEAALRAMIEVLDAGWPLILSSQRRAECSGPAAGEADRALLSRDGEGRRAIRLPLWTLWEEHVSTRGAADVNDLSVAAAVFLDGPPPEVYARFEEQLRRRDPGIDDQALSNAGGEFRREKMQHIVDWALDTCRSKGGEWDSYARQFSGHDEYLHDEGWRVAIRVLDDPPFSDTSRYAGRTFTFLGPPERREKLIPFHQMLDFIRGRRERLRAR